LAVLCGFFFVRISCPIGVEAAAAKISYCNHVDVKKRDQGRLKVEVQAVHQNN
jgi:hypothetical protein